MLPKRSHSCNFVMVRRESLLCPAAAGVAVGAMLSPAAVDDLIDMDRSEADPLTNKCIWGCGELGSHHHTTWQCNLRPRKLLPAGPIDARFGWQKKSSLLWLASVQKKIWESRHNKDPPGLRFVFFGWFF